MRAYASVPIFVLAAACGTTPGPQQGAPDAATPPVTRTGLEKCAAGMGQLHQIWSAANQHGEIVAMSGVDADNVFVVTSKDGSVKQWRIGAAPTANPVYGQPFDPDTGAVVGALALAPDGAVLAAGDDASHVLTWETVDTTLTSNVVAAADPITAIGLAADAKSALVGDLSFAGLRRWDLVAGTVGLPLTTSLWGVRAIAYVPGHDLALVAGDNYGRASVEARAAADPTAAGAAWVDNGGTSGSVRAIAITGDGARAVVAADALIAVLSIADLAGTPLATQITTGHTPVGAVLTPSGDFAATASSEGAIQLWDAHTAAAIGAPLMLANPIGLAIDGAGERLVTATKDGNVVAFACQ